MNSSAVSSALFACSLLCLPPLARSQDIGEAVAIPAKPPAVRPGDALGHMPKPTITPASPGKPLSLTPESALSHLDRDNTRDSFQQRVYLQEAAQAPPQQAIPILERYYAKHQNDPGEQGAPPLRVSIASVLVRLHDPNPLYWDILVTEAEAALASPVPSLSKNGKGPDDSYSPAQKAWANAHNISLAQMSDRTSFEILGKFAPLAESQDPRGIPILRRGLQSQNHRIQMLAAKGLAALHDKDSIPLIIAACQNTVASPHFIADNLIYFNDPTADKVFQDYFPDVNIEQERQRRGDNPFRSAASLDIQSGATTSAPSQPGFSIEGAAPAPPPRKPPNPDTAPAPASGSPASSPAGVKPHHP